MGLHETKMLLQNKRNGHQIEEAANRMEKIFPSCTSDSGLIIRIYRDIKKLTEKESMIHEDGQNNSFFKGRSQNGYKTHEEMFTIPAYIYEMQIKPTLRFHLTLFKWLSSATKTTTNIDED
jgi:hypothetical protein